MLEAKDLLKATLDNGRALMRIPEDEGQSQPGEVRTPVLIPIRSLGVNHRGRIERHLLALSPQDRYLRFGYAAQDTHIERYVAGLDFDRDEIFGIYNRKLQLLAVAHLAYSVDAEFQSCAEFGVSVSASARGRHYGSRLFERAAMHASNDGVHLMFIHALNENSAMLNIARKAGATVERDGMESEAFLYLPKATLDSRMTELVEEQLGQTDYRIKLQARQFWRLLSQIQKVRRTWTGDDAKH
jgi:RimJ/RimL family protein N-acetyltransferase